MKMRWVLWCMMLIPATAWGQAIDWQKTIDGSRWGWSDEATTPLYCAVRQADVPVTLAVTQDKRVEISAGAIKLVGHEHTVFHLRDGVMYHALYHPSSSGATIVAIDVATGKELWRSRVTGLGGVEHSAYSNHLNLQAGKDVLIINGRESFGLYQEFKRLTDGETVANRVFTRTRLTNVPDRWLIRREHKDDRRDPFLLHDVGLDNALSATLTDAETDWRGENPNWANDLKPGEDIRTRWRDQILKDYPSLLMMPLDDIDLWGQTTYDTAANEEVIARLLPKWEGKPELPRWTKLAIQRHHKPDEFGHTDEKPRLELLARLLKIAERTAGAKK